MNYTVLATRYGVPEKLIVAHNARFGDLPTFALDQLARHPHDTPAQLTFQSGGVGYTIIVGDRYDGFVFDEEGVGQWERENLGM